MTTESRSELTVSASIVTADLLHLERDLDQLVTSGVDSIHLDLEDGNFVPVMNLGTRLIEAAVRWGRLPVDVHLMVADAELALRILNGLELRTVAIHLESTLYPRRALRMVRDMGWRASLAINPSTALPDLLELSPYLDELLMLTTEPEEGNAPFIQTQLPKIAEAVQRAEELGAGVIVDGGVNQQNAQLLAAAGVDGVVVGRALFDSEDPGRLIAAIKKGDNE